MMKHAAEISGKFGVLGKLAAAMALGFAMGAAHADTVTFGGFDPTFVGDSDYFEQAGVYLTGYSNAIGSQPGDLVGAIVDGSDLAGGPCYGLACPTNNQTTFYAGLNDGILQLDTTTPGQSIHVYSLDASFIGAVQGGSYPITSGLLLVQGFYADGSSTYTQFNLAGPTTGSFNFKTYNTSAAFAAQSFAAVDIFAYVCDVSGSCKAFQTNQGQFAIDNINLGPTVSAVPEPASWLMLGLGLAGITAAARRKNKRA